MKNELHLRGGVFLILLFTSIFALGQNTKDYYIEINDSIDLGTIQKTVNQDQTISITTQVASFTSFINTKQVYAFRQAYPGATTQNLKNFFRIKLLATEDITSFENNSDINQIYELSNEPVLTGHYPNDYIENFYENLPNTHLELIKAPLAWTITKGDPNVIVGVSDSPIDFAHEDLQGQFTGHIIIDDIPYPHGTAVSSLIAANTNNGIGVASIGYNTKMFAASCANTLSSLMEGLWQVSLQPGVKVINCSFASSTFRSEHSEIVKDITNRGILIVAAAGNENTGIYKYPASYDETLSVTSIGTRYPIGYYHNNSFFARSWKDVFLWRPDTGNSSSNNFNNKVDVSSPAHYIISATSNYTSFPEGYRPQINTSSATPIVSGLAALIFSIEPTLTPQEVKDIIRDTADDVYHIPYNQPFNGLIGTGRINAFRAVKTTDCINSPDGSLDLAMQNSRFDSFQEPDTDTEILWESHDIWVRNQNDGTLIEEHQNPFYDINNPNDPNNRNYVYVNVTNNSCVTSTEGNVLKLYWSKANTALSWPTHWDGSLYMEDPVTGQGVLMGDEIGQVTIPPLSPGEDVALEFEWLVPNPQDYININPNPWHFCLLARIESTTDLMTFPETDEITLNVKNNNNIAWKNMSVITLQPDIITNPGATVAVGNPTSVSKAYDLEFQIDPNETGSSIYEEAEVSVEIDSILYNAWNTGGKLQQHFKNGKTNNRKIVIDNNARLENIQFAPNEIGTMYVSFNFLTKEATQKEKFTYRVIQRDAVTDSIIGGETYVINRIPRPTFEADAGGDEEIDRSESVTITAAQINEAAIYNWYDPDGNLVYTGTDLTVSPEVTMTYQLEVISDIDGYKDYDEVEIEVNPYRLESLVPNPAANQVSANYIANGANSAYLMVVNTIDGTSNNYIIDPSLSTISLNVSNYPSGLYSVALVCDGKIVDSKNLIKQ